ncbi:MAG: hypothetical protein KKD44_26990, partial [Proteobacteria bacterium]|nr:hypothetical protein [Pseudomonadota bacterium]
YGISIYGDNGDIQSNKCYGNTENGIRAEASADGTHITNNYVYNNVAGQILNQGTNTKVQFNKGFITEIRGISTGTGAQQTIAHGLSGIPDYVFFSNIEDGANPYQSTAADATNIYVTAVVDLDYAWEAIYEP